MAKQPVYRGDPPMPLWGMRNGIMVPLWAEDPCDTACCEDEDEPEEPPANFPICNCTVHRAELTISGLGDVLSDDPCQTDFKWSRINGGYTSTDFVNGLQFHLAEGNCSDRGPFIRERTHSLCPQSTSDAALAGQTVHAIDVDLACNDEVDFLGSPTGRAELLLRGMAFEYGYYYLDTQLNCNFQFSGVRVACFPCFGHATAVFPRAPGGGLVSDSSGFVDCVCGVVVEADFEVWDPFLGRVEPGTENGHMRLVLMGQCQAPQVTLTETPPVSTQNTSATFAWETAGFVQSSTIQLDDQPPVPGTTPHTYTNLSLGTHTFRVTVANDFGSDIETYVWEVTETAPSCLPPTVVFTQKPPFNTGPTVTFTWATTGTVRKTEIRREVDGFWQDVTGTNTITLTFTPGGHDFYVRVDSLECGAAQTQWGFLVSGSGQAPAVTLTQTPPATTTSTSGTFAWTTTGQVDTTTCELDGQQHSCISPRTYNGLSLGPHTFRVTVANSFGSDTKTYSWTISSTPAPQPPTVTITQAPPSSTPNTSATFAWSTLGPIQSMTCQLDGGAQSNCTSPLTYNNLAPGQHTFLVRVANADGNDQDSHTWTIEPPVPQPPSVTLTQTPPVSTTNTTATFAWTTTGPIATTTCQLDGGAPQNCSTPRSYTGLAPGPHTFTVTVANADGTDFDSFTWTVTEPPPNAPTVTLTQTPPTSTQATTATFAWTTTGTIDTMTCQLDSGAQNNCTSPLSYNNLAPGPHTFTVRVSNASGSDDDSFSWTVTEPPPNAPTVTLIQTPPATTQDTSGTFAWTTTGQIDITTCELDGVPATCSSPITYTNLSLGVHTFRVTVGNASGSDSEFYSWTITAQPGTTLCEKIVQLMRITDL